MSPRRLAARKRVARTAASSRPSRRAAIVAEEKTRGILVKPEPKPKPQPTVDRSIQNSYFDREVPCDVLFIIMNKYLDNASATCLGLTCKKAYDAWEMVFDKGTIDLFERTSNAAGVTLPLKFLLMEWMGPDMHFDVLTGKYMSTEDIQDHYEEFRDSFTDWQAKDQDDREWQAYEDARRDAEDEYADRQRRLHAGTVAHAYQVAGYSSHKQYDSELEEEPNSSDNGDADSMDIDESENGDSDEHGEGNDGEEEEEEGEDTHEDTESEGGNGTDAMDESGEEVVEEVYEDAELDEVINLLDELPLSLAAKSNFVQKIAAVHANLQSFRIMAIFLALKNLTEGIEDTITFLTEDARALEKLQMYGYDGALER